jgi:hypothetical protein
MDDYRWVVCFDTAMFIRNICFTNEETAKSSVEYYRGIYPHVKIMDEQQLNKTLKEDSLRKKIFSLELGGICNV